MRNKTCDFINRLKEMKYPPYVEKIIIYGSEVYGTPNIFSDIDIAAVLNNVPSRAQRIDIDEIIDEAEPPYEYQLIFISKQGKIKKWDVRKDVFEKGMVVYAK